MGLFIQNAKIPCKIAEVSLVTCEHAVRPFEYQTVRKRIDLIIYKFIYLHAIMKRNSRLELITYKLICFYAIMTIQNTLK